MLRVDSYTTDGQFAVLFTDVGNSGDLTLAVCQVTASSGIARSTPNLLVTEYSSASAAGSTLPLNQEYQWASFAVGRRQSGNGQMLLASAETDAVSSTPHLVTFAVLESRPRPAGVLQSSNQVTLSGSVTVNGRTPLVPGAVYYALTNGSLLQSSTPLGQYPLAPGYTSASVYISPRLLEYVEVNGVAVTMDSRVGVATSTSSLLLLPVA